ncbi:hypothetical protein [Pseudoxanthomonas koreensis]|uniref:hypothetical protein n=1 Tax=Pseudoxanthomonas koreensis TaxID=266061 RepID=UPI0035A6FCF9
MRTLIAAALLAALPLSANAAEGLSYNYVEAGWTQVEVDGIADPDGGYLRGSFLIGQQVNLFAGYSRVSESFGLGTTRVKYEQSQPEFGIGYHQEFSDRLDFTADLAWLRLEAKARVTGAGGSGSASDDINAGRATVGLRGKPSPRTELWTKAGYIDGSDVDGSFVGVLGGQVSFTRNWGLVGEVEVIEDSNFYRVGVRASF